MEWVDRLPWQLVAAAGVVGFLTLLRYVQIRLDD
jgi:ElaB/YqjD/DUF883 family membrane-anchored ribosome-binding protein